MPDYKIDEVTTLSTAATGLMIANAAYVTETPDARDITLNGKNVTYRDFAVKAGGLPCVFFMGDGGVA